MDNETINKKLRSFYEFDENDLHENRNGRMSEKQTKLLQMRNSALYKGGLAAGGFFLLIALCIGALFLLVLVISILDNKWEYSTSIGPLIYSGIAFLIFASIAAFILISTLRSRKSTGRFRFESGPVHIRAIQMTSSSEHSATRHYTQYQMKIGNSNEFVLDDEMVEIVKEGEEFTIYYYDFDNGTEGLILAMEKR